MPFTPEQVYNTLKDTPDGFNLDIPQSNESLPTQETPTNPNTESGNVEPPVQQATNEPANTFNLDAELEKISGGAIKTKDEIARLLETSKNFPEIESQLGRFKEENEQLKAKVNANPFANDFSKKINDLYASGANESQIEAFIAINKVNLDTLTPLQTSSLALQIKHGLSQEEADRYIAKKYDIDLSDLASIDRDAEIALKVDSGIDKEFLKTHKAQVEQTPVDRTEQQRQLEQQEYSEKIAKLQPIAKETVNNVLTNAFKSVSINGKEGEGSITIDLPISQESKTNLEKVVNDFVQSNWKGITPDEKGIQSIKDFASNVLVIQNYKNWIIDAASKTDLRVRAEYTNASPINRGNAAEPLGKTKAQERTEGVLSTLKSAGYL